MAAFRSASSQTGIVYAGFLKRWGNKKIYTPAHRVLASHCLNPGHFLCSNGQLKQGRGYLIKAVKAYPLNVKYPGAALASLLGQSAYNMAAASYRKIRAWFSKEQ
jgi:hypothetical protein